MAIDPSKNQTNEADIFTRSNHQVFIFLSLLFHNVKHIVTVIKDPIRYLATSYYFDTVWYTNKRQLSHTLNMKIQPLSCFYCLFLVLVLCVKYLQRLPYQVEQHNWFSVILWKVFVTQVPVRSSCFLWVSPYVSTTLHLLLNRGFLYWALCN